MVKYDPKTNTNYVLNFSTGSIPILVRLKMRYWFIAIWKTWPRVSRLNLPSQAKSPIRPKNVKLGFQTFPAMADLPSRTKPILTKLLSYKCFQPKQVRMSRIIVQILWLTITIAGNIIGKR